MYPIPGHLAMSMAGAYFTGLPYVPAIVATFAVDVIDKPLSDILYWTPYGRCWFHTLLSVAVCSLVAGKVMGRKWGFSWMLGHLLHLIGDISFVPWFYPFLHYDWPYDYNVVHASAQGIEEFFQGFRIVSDAAGHWHWSGWHFSTLVATIFKGNLMLVELGMLLASFAFWPFPNQWIEKYRPLGITLFFLFFAWRTLYNFPDALAWISSFLGGPVSW